MPSAVSLSGLESGSRSRGVRYPFQQLRWAAQRPQVKSSQSHSLVTMARPGPILSRALRLPIVFYRIGVGGLLGHRFLLLTHRGRRSGQLHQTMLEVVKWRSSEQEAIVMSGFGPHSNWLLNVLAEDGAVEVRIARLRFRPQVRRLGAEEAVGALADYEHRNQFIAPIVQGVLSRLGGFPYDGSDESRLRLVKALPLLALSPKHVSFPGDAGGAGDD